MIKQSGDDTKQCPECAADVQNTVAYTHGHRTSDGWECTECDWWCLFGEGPWNMDAETTPTTDRRGRSSL